MSSIKLKLLSLAILCTLTASGCGGKAGTIAKGFLPSATTATPTPTPSIDGLNYDSNVLSFTKHSTITSIPPTLTLGTAKSFSSNPFLPTGLILNPTVGTISGTPSTPVAQSSFLISASNGTQSTSKAVKIEVLGTSPTQSTITASSAQVIADASTTSTITVTFKDKNGVAIQNENVSLASSRGSSIDTILPISAKTSSTGVATFTVKSNTVGSANFIATDSDDNITLIPVASVNFIAGPATQLVLSSLPSPAIAGTSFNYIVTATDAYGHVATSYSRTIGTTSTDVSAVLPASAALTNGIGTFAITLKTAGSKMITVGDGTLSKSTAVSVNPGAYSTTQSVVTAASSSVNSGGSMIITLTTKDAYGNLNPSGLPAIGSIAFNSSAIGGSGTYSATTNVGSGVYTASFTGANTGAVTLGATISGVAVANNANITVTAGTGSQLVISGLPASVNSGSAQSFTVTAKDPSNNTVTSYSGTVSITSNDGAATLPASATLVNGVGTFSITLRTAGTKSISASDGTLSTTASISVTAGSASQLVFGSVPASATAGTLQTFTVTAKDASNNTVTSYGGTVTITSSDGAAVLSASSTLTSGVGTFTSTFKTSGTQTLTAGDGTHTVTSTGITVNPGTATQLVLTGIPATATAGASNTFSVTAKDAYSNVATGYAGTVTITSDDGAATIPGASTLNSGTKSFSATLNTAGTQHLTASDGTLTVTSSGITVSAGAATQLVLTGVTTSITAGNSQTFIVTAKDASNNVATGYAGTISVTSDDGAAVLPTASTLTSGTKSFSITLKTAGTMHFSVGDGTLSATSAGITVSPAAASQLALSGVPASTTSGASQSFTVTAKDVFGNTATSYAGTVAITSDDGAATLPSSSTLTSGTKSFSITLNTAGTKHITAGDGTFTVTSSGITVNPSTATQLALSSVPASATSGSSQSFTVTAKDAYNNTATGYAGTVAITSDDGSAILPTSSTLTSGTKSFSITLKTAGTKHITAGDGTLTITSSGITVNASTATQVLVSSGDAQSGTVATALTNNFTAIVEDAYGNVVQGTNVTWSVASGGGSVSATSSSSDASGLAVSKLTLGTTAGSNTVTATVGSSHATFTATGTAGTATTMTLVSGDNQSGSQGAVLSNAFVVVVKDTYNNLVQNKTVTWAVTSGAGTLSSASNSTDSNGNSSSTLTLGATAGSNVVTATLSGTATTVTFTSTTNVGTPATITLVSGNNQSKPAGSTSDSMVVVVKDSNGNKAPNATVDWATTAGGGSMTSTSNSTDSSGLTSSTLILGTLNGTNTVTATIHGTSTKVTFTLTGVSGAASQILVSSGDAQSAIAGSALTNNFVAVVEDTYGNVVQGTTVDWTVVLGAGTLSSASGTSTSSGLSSSKLTTGTTAGTNTASAKIHGTNTSVTFTATGTAGAATQLSINSGDGQSATVGTSPTNSISILAQDANNNAASGATIVWASASGGGSVNSNSGATSGMGIASAAVTLGTTTGSNTFTATLSGTATSVTITLNGTAGSATQITQVSGDAQSGVAGTLLANPFIVLVQDQYNNPVQNASIDWAITGGNGSVSPVATTTTADGNTSNTLTLDSVMGSNSASATINGSNPPISVSFSATGTAGLPALISISGGDNQTGSAGAPLAKALSVKVTDSNGNIVANTNVKWKIDAGDGVLSSLIIPTNLSGIASVTYTLGQILGNNKIEASIGAPLVIFNETNGNAPAGLIVTANTTKFPTGWMLPDGNTPLKFTIDLGLIQNGSAVGYQCRDYLLSTVTVKHLAAPPWQDCSPGTFTPTPTTGASNWMPNSGGTYRLEVQAVDAHGDPTQNYHQDFYVHPSLNGVPLCNIAHSNSDYFQAAAAVLDMSHSFPSTSVTAGSTGTNPFIQFQFNRVAAPKQYAANNTRYMLSLRKSVSVNGDGTLVLITRQYAKWNGGTKDIHNDDSKHGRFQQRPSYSANYLLPSAKYGNCTLAIPMFNQATDEKTSLHAEGIFPGAGYDKHQNRISHTIKNYFGVELPNSNGPAIISTNTMSCDALVFNAAGKGLCFFNGVLDKPIPLRQVATMFQGDSGFTHHGNSKHGTYGNVKAMGGNASAKLLSHAKIFDDGTNWELANVASPDTDDGTPVFKNHIWLQQ